MANAAAREERSVVTLAQQVTGLSALGGTSRRLLANVSLALLLFGGLAVGPACARDEPAVKKKAADDDGDSPKKSKKKKAADEDGEDDSRTKKSDDDQVSSKKKRKSADEESPKAAPPAFEVNERVVRAAFLETFPSIANGHKLSATKIAIGDLDGNGTDDAVVLYGLETTFDDHLGNGNGWIDGVAAFKNGGAKLVLADNSRKFTSGEFGFEKYSNVSIKAGIIVLDGSFRDLSGGAARKATKLSLVLRNGLLVKLDP
jgi:hypothetical protein